MPRGGPRTPSNVKLLELSGGKLRGPAGDCANHTAAIRLNSHMRRRATVRTGIFMASWHEVLRYTNQLASGRGFRVRTYRP